MWRCTLETHTTPSLSSASLCDYGVLLTSVFPRIVAWLQFSTFATLALFYFKVIMHSEWESKWKRRSVAVFLSSTAAVFSITCVWAALGSQSDDGDRYGNLEAGTVGLFFFLLSFAFAFIAWSIPRLRANECSLAFIVKVRCTVCL